MSPHPIPDIALDSDIAVLGRKGGGKTYTAKGIVERLLDMGRRVLILDPLGVWAGLRTAADGESAGYPVAIFGGQHGDMPLNTAAAVAMADVLARENVPAVVDLSDLSKTTQQSFLLAFLHELRRVNTEALTLVLEEADVFAPQNPQGDDSKALHGEIDWIARRGRFKGFRLLTITQRPARLSKDVLTQANCLVMHRLPAPQDRDAAKAWVGREGDGAIPGAAKKMRAVLDTNPPVARSWQQVATLAGLKARGGHYNAGRKWLIESGTAIESGGLVRIAKPSAGAGAPVTDPVALVEQWCTSLSGAAPRILRALFDHAKTVRTKSAVAACLNLKPVGGHWNAAWKELRDNEIVRVDGDYVELTELFKPRRVA